jgi:hypothetical protein
MANESRNYIEYVDSVEYVLKEASRYYHGTTSHTYSEQFEPPTDQDTSVDNADREYTSDSAYTQHQGAIDGLATGGFTSRTNYSRTEGSASSLHTGSNAAGKSGDSKSAYRTEFAGSTKTYEQTEDGDKSQYTGNNTKYNSSREYTNKRFVSTIGEVNGDTEGTGATLEDSNGRTVNQVFIYNDPLNAITNAHTHSGKGGYTSQGDFTRSNSYSNEGGRLVELSPALRTQIVKNITKSATKRESEKFTVNIMIEGTTAVQGGNTYKVTDSHLHATGSGLTSITYDSDDNAGQLVEGTQTQTGDTDTYAASGATYSNTYTFSYSKSGLNRTGRTQSMGTYSNTFEGTNIKNDSYPISLYYGLPESLSNTETMRIYSFESSEMTQTIHGVIRSTFVEDNAMLLSPYNYDYYEISTIIFEGGLGAYGFTQTDVLNHSLKFTTFKTEDVSTKVVVNANSRRILTRALSCNAVSKSENTDDTGDTGNTGDTGDTGDTDSTNNDTDNTPKTEYTKPVQDSSAGTTNIINATTLTSAITVNYYESPTGSAYRDHNFYDETASTRDTTTTNVTLYYRTSSSYSNGKHYTKGIETVEVDLGEKIVTWTDTNEYFEAYNSTETFFNFDEVEEYEVTKLGVTSTYEEIKRSQIGIFDASVNVIITEHARETNIIYEDVPTPELYSFSSRPLGLMYLSDSTTDIGKRQVCNPPVISYTEDYLTSTRQTHVFQDATVVTLKTHNKHSYYIPNIQQFYLDGHPFLIRDEKLTVHDIRANSISYNSTGERIESRATFRKTYTTRSTLVDGAEVDVTDTYNGTRLFNTFFKNIDGCTPMDDLPTCETRFINAIEYNQNGDSYFVLGSEQYYFGGCPHYNSQGKIYFLNSHKFTLVDREDSNKTTVVSGNLQQWRGNDSIALDMHSNYFISTKTEHIAGSTDARLGNVATRIYKRNTYSIDDYYYY